MTRSRSLLLLLLLTALLGAVSIDARSLWTDEIGTWSLTVANGPLDWARRFWHHPNSDGQIPLYHLAMYLWTQALGSSELALRAANLPWLMLGLVGLARLRVAPPLRWLTIAAFCLHPLVWYQLNEARPYLLHLAGACWLLAGGTNLLLADETTELDASWRELLVGSFLLIGSSVLGAFWVVGALLAFAVGAPAKLLALTGSARRQPAFTTLLLLGSAIALGVAVHSHLAGARASLAASFSLAGLAYGAIELLGAAGLGPSRHALRAHWQQADAQQLVLMALAALLAAVCLLLAWLKQPSTRSRLISLTALLAPMAMLAGLGIALHWRVVGRHLSGGLPLLCLAYAAFVYGAWRQGGAGRRLLAGLLILAWVASSASIRLAERHGKDDYRQAAAWARAALSKGQSVLWLANERAIGYYQLSGWTPDGIVDLPPRLIPYTHYPDWVAAGGSEPDVVILSPREGVDPDNLARPVLSNDHYRKTATAIAFELYDRR